MNKKYVFIKNQKNVNLSKGTFYETGKEYGNSRTSIFVAFSTFEVISDGIKPINFSTYIGNTPSASFLRSNAEKFVYWKWNSTTFSQDEVIPAEHVLSNKYYTSTGSGSWIFIPSSNTGTSQSNSKFSMTNCWSTSVSISSTVLGTYTSTDPNAYSPLTPPVCGGIWYDRYNQEGYTTVQKREVRCSGLNPVAISFSEIPKLLFIYAKSSYGQDEYGIVYICIATDTKLITKTLGSAYISVNVTDDATVSFQCQVDGTTGYGIVYAIY